MSVQDKFACCITAWLCHQKTTRVDHVQIIAEDTFAAVGFVLYIHFRKVGGGYRVQCIYNVYTCLNFHHEDLLTITRPKFQGKSVSARGISQVPPPPV